MQITLDLLEKALAPIEAIGRGETTFDVGGTPLTLRVLFPEEEAAIQKYAAQAMTDEEGAALEYLERFKLSVLSYALVSVGDQDFREVQFIETEEKLPSGLKVKVPKAEAVRKLLTRWSGVVRSGMFRKYVELTTRIEKESEKIILFEPSDTDSEIERLGKRLEQLKAEKERLKDDSSVSSVSKMAKVILTQEEDQKALKQEAAEEKQPVARQSIVPEHAAPPPPAPSKLDVEPAAPPSATQPGDTDDSFLDPADASGMEAAIARENKRRLVDRQRARQPLPTAPAASVLTSTLGSRRPPHLDAQEAATATFVDGAMRLPVEEITKRAPPPADQPAPINPTLDTQGTRNPRFRPPARG